MPRTLRHDRRIITRNERATALDAVPATAHTLRTSVRALSERDAHPHRFVWRTGMHIRFLVERSSPMRSHHRRSRRRLLVLLTAFLLPVGGLLALLGPAATATVTASAVPAPPSGWTTVFSDDFTGSAGSGLNTSNWLYDTGTGYSGGAANWGTNEVETMTSSTNNVYQDGNGHLVIKPIRASA